MTLPQFISAGSSVTRIRACRARDEVFFGISGAFGDDKARRALFDTAGSCEREQSVDYSSIDEDAMRVAQERMRKAIARLEDGGKQC